MIPGLKKAAGGDDRSAAQRAARRSAAQIEQQARAELVKAGADERSTSVTVLSAYKQGYSWLYDVVRPALAGKPVDRITIRFAEIGPPSGWKQQGMFAPTRWLLELYPIDEILANELKIDLKKIHFEMTPIGSPAYEVVATAAGGSRAAATGRSSRSSSSGRSSIASRITSACGSPPAGSRRTWRAAPWSTSGSQPIPNDSGITSRRRRCPRCTTT